MMEEVVRYFIDHTITISTMESCTGGLLASAITDNEGSSAIFKGGFVTYSNEAKVMQGVPAEIIETFGVYSPQVAAAMAKACRRTYRAEVGVGVTGTLGNYDPNNADSVPGEIYYAIAYGGDSKTCSMTFDTAGLTRYEMKERIVKDIAASLWCLKCSVYPEKQSKTGETASKGEFGPGQKK